MERLAIKEDPRIDREDTRIYLEDNQIRKSIKRGVIRGKGT